MLILDIAGRARGRHQGRRSPAQDHRRGAPARRADDPHRHHRAGGAHHRPARRRHLRHGHAEPPLRRHRARALDRRQGHRREGGADVAPGPIPILRVGANLLATVHVELRDAVAEAFQEDVLDELEKRRAPRASSSTSAASTWSTPTSPASSPRPGGMAKLMGTETVLVGMRPEVAATLVRMGYAMEGVHTALNVDDGLETLAELTGRREEAERWRDVEVIRQARDADRERGRRRPGAPQGQQLAAGARLRRLRLRGDHDRGQRDHAQRLGARPAGAAPIVEEITDGARFGPARRVPRRGAGHRRRRRACSPAATAPRARMGLGLSGSRRLVDEFEIESAPGRGTTVRMVKWTRF